MPSGFEKGVGFAGTGAGIGTAIAPGIGTAIGAGAGFLTGLFMGSDPEVQSPTYADINLEQEHPDLYKKLLESEQAVKVLYENYQKTTQPSEANIRDREQLREKVDSNLAASGLSGTSVGIASMADATATMQAKQDQERFLEEQQAYNNYLNGLMQAYSQRRGLYQDVMGAKTGAYNAAREDEAAANQFYSNLFSGGLQMMGSSFNNARMADAIKTSPRPAYPAVPYFTGPTYPSSAGAILPGTPVGLTPGQQAAMNYSAGVP